MTRDLAPLDVYLEVGARRTFAGAVDWPGWCRAGRDESGALQALLDAAPRYVPVLAGSTLDVRLPTDRSHLNVVERLPGNATTDFGAPDAIPTQDERPLGHADVERFAAILQGCWRVFDDIVERARGHVLRKGPRGGGRDLAGIIDHVLGAEISYLGRLGPRFRAGKDSDPETALRDCRAAILDGLAAAARGELPAQGPRGGKRWPPRYFVRRSAWHTLDHAWEIEDRLVK